jgi:hypothetical protein
MDEDGNCYPSQARLANDLVGIQREHMNKRIKRLLAFRFHGEPIVTMKKTREKAGGQQVGQQRVSPSADYRPRYVRGKGALKL